MPYNQVKPGQICAGFLQFKPIIPQGLNKVNAKNIPALAIAGAGIYSKV